MFANQLTQATRRRGIVLVLILGMLGLLALIGVTFATFAGQAVVNARNFNSSEGRPGAEQYMDFALGQLINDTNNPLSAIRGHSLLRDMYGNDSTFRGTVAADFGGLLQTVTQPTGATTPLLFPNDSNPVSRPYAGTLTAGLVGRGYLQFRTNIPTAASSYQYFGLNFTRWIVKTQNVYNNNGVLTAVSQTFEVLEDDDTGSDSFCVTTIGTTNVKCHILTLGPIDGATHLYSNPTKTLYPGENNDPTNDKAVVTLASPLAPLPANGLSFVLDGRYMNAFNGPGMSKALIPVIGASGLANNTPSFPPLVPFNTAAYANFKVNGALVNPASDPTFNFPYNITTNVGATNTSFGNPDLIGMDEDYDACDLENWFLALQSADGQVMIPSFHRPSILTATDWTSRTAAAGAANIYEAMNAVAGIAKILRPRQIDNAPQFPADPSTPDVLTGKITYDVDNDGDGVTDSVWLDLGYPVQKSPGGKLFKPLFAFMVIGQNGRLPLNTVGNLQERDSQTQVTYPIPANPMLPTQVASAATYFDAPTWDHASHVGASVNEINPKFALQNAPANIWDTKLVNTAGNNAYPGTIFDLNSLASVTAGAKGYSQVDNAGVDIALTQLRNILAGTIPMDNLTNPASANNASQEGNFVIVNGQQWWVPNSLIDGQDPNAFQNNIVPRVASPAVPGRWGEPEGIPRYLVLDTPNTGNQPVNPLFSRTNLGYTPNYPYTYPMYLNPVGAGRSIYSSITLSADNSYEPSFDLMDDDGDGVTPPFGVSPAEINPIYDAAGQIALPAERTSRYLTPSDPTGNGQLVSFMTRPVDYYDHGSGYDANGRMSFFRYFRPPGLPQAIDYASLNSRIPTSSPYYIDRFNMPTFLGPGGVAGTESLVAPNRTNNQYHNYEAFRAPAPNGGYPYGAAELSKISVMAAMPFDYVASKADSGNTTQDTHNNFQLWPPVTFNADGYTTSFPTVVTGTTVPLMSGSSITYPYTAVGSRSGPYLLGYGQAIPMVQAGETPVSTNYPSAGGPGYLDNNGAAGTGNALVVNGYPLGSFNKDEADEMNLYTPNRYDQQFGPSDLEWLYRKQDVDGSTLNSRLSQLAPVSFLNPADGQTRRRLFSVDSWDPNNYIWANDNPLVFNPAAYLALQTAVTNGTAYPGPSTQPQNAYNSRFAPFGNASFATLNEVADTSAYSHFANVNSVEVIPNALLDAPIIANATYYYQPSLNPNPYDPSLNPNPDMFVSGGPTTNYTPHSGLSVLNPLLLTVPSNVSVTNPATYSSYQTTIANGNSPYYPNLTNGLSSLATNPTTLNTAAYPIPTPALAHRDRRINLNMPLPVANDPTEPVRQKWCRETYQMLKAVLPPQATDTPQELAALSQFVVNIIDFRDPDSTMTRFVNTDLMIIQPTATAPTGLKFAEKAPVIDGTGAPIQVTPLWDLSGNTHTFYPYDPRIADEQTNPSTDWIKAMTDTVINKARPLYLVQYGMEYNPIAINEVLAYAWYTTPVTTKNQTQAQNILTPKFYIELLNTLSDDTSHNALATGTPTPGSGDMNLAGWDFIITPDTDNQGRPDSTTGQLPATVGLISNTAISVAAGTGADNTLSAGAPTNAQPPSATTNWTTYNSMIPSPVTASFPANSFGWTLDQNYGLLNASTLPGTVSFIPSLRGSGVIATPNPRTGVGTAAGMNSAGMNQVIGDGYYVLGSTVTTGGLDRSPALTGAPDFPMPSTFFPSPGTGPTAPPGNQYYWLYLRRPANPFNPGQEMVVVDSFRFPYIVNQTKGQTKPTVPGPPEVGPWYDQYLSGEQPTGLTKSNEVFSLQRLQPFRGGHHISRTPPYGNGLTSPSLGTPQGHSFGYFEQTTPVSGGSPGTGTPPSTALIYGPNNPLPGITNNSGISSTSTPQGYYIPAGYVYDTIGYENNPKDTQWDYFPFHDRDFNSPAELLLVPGCPPGLFTKEFAEQAFDITKTQTPITVFPNTASATETKAWSRTDTTVVLADTALTAPYAFPYLNDEFYYTAVSVDPNTTDSADLMINGPYPTQLGGWTGTGWYKMLDFFEVPSSANGAIGTADAGENFDWFRQDMRPGLLNLNLIIDEEVFFGLLDDPRINMALAQYGYYLNNYYYEMAANNSTVYPVTSPNYPNLATLPIVISQVDPYGNPSAFYNISDPNVAGSAITSIAPGYRSPSTGNLDFNTYASSVGGTYLPIYPSVPQAPNQPLNTSYVGRGFSYPDPAFSYAGMGPLNSGSTYSQNLITGMKASFADFLKLRHGGSNFLFGHQAPYSPPGMLALTMNVGMGGNLPGGPIPIGPNNSTTSNNNLVWPDKPYRSLSYPDVNYTIMRPALAVPSITQSSYTTAVPTAGTSPMSFPGPYYYDDNLSNTGNNSPIQSYTLLALGLKSPNLPTAAGSYVGDPGIRFPWMDLTFTNVAKYNTAYNSPLGTTGNRVPMVPPIPPRRLFAPPDSSGNAGTTGDNMVNATTPNFILNYAPLANPYLADPNAQLITTNSVNTVNADMWSNYIPQPPNTTAYNPSLIVGTVPSPVLGGNYKQQAFIDTGKRQHPYYRTEILQKVMNLTTVRTHQFAVWITVGFFEVVHVGTPELGIPDILGAEVDLAAGRNVRYRSFFVIDRTKATGFNPYYPGEFRNCVTYRRRIE